MASRTDEDWADVINGLGMLRSGAHANTPPIRYERDRMVVMSNPNRFSQSEIATLERMGFIANYPDGTFRYGSA